MTAERVSSNLAIEMPDLTPTTPSMPLKTRLQVVPPEPVSSERPLEPLEFTEPPPPPPEPAPWTTTAKEWEIWVGKRDNYENFNDQLKKARAYAEENDLRGTF